MSTTSENTHTSDSTEVGYGRIDDASSNADPASNTDAPVNSGSSPESDASTSNDHPMSDGSGEVDEDALVPTQSARVSARTQDPAPDAERHHVLVQTPFGGLYAVAAGGSVVALYHEHHDPNPGPAGLGQPLCTPGENTGDDPPWATAAGTEASSINTDVLRRARQELAEYFEGRRRRFSFPMDARGTAFQEDVWRALARIPFGERRSYRDIATSLGNPAMGRAIGAAVRANPLSIAIPGHRVVSSSGKVVGYAAGTGVKSALLDFERSLCLPPGSTAAEGKAPRADKAPTHLQETPGEVPSDPGRE